MATFIWELGMFACLFAFIMTFGAYLDGSDGTSLRVMSIIMMIVFGSIFLLPIGVFNFSVTLPSLIGLFMLPLTKLSKGIRRSGANFYLVMITLQYLCIMCSLVLLYMAAGGSETVLLFHVTIPACIAFTVIPAITLPVLFFFGNKGRYELTFVYTILFPLWGPLMMGSASFNEILDVSTDIIFLPMYLAFAFSGAYAICSFCLAIFDYPRRRYMLSLAFGFGIVVSIPTYLVMPLLLATLLDYESSPSTTFMNGFAPLYIDLIILFVVSVISLFVDELKIDTFSSVIRNFAKSLSPCRVVKDMHEK